MIQIGMKQYTYVPMYIINMIIQYHTYYKMFETTKQSKYICISKKKQYRYQFQLLDIMWNPGNIAL